MIKKTQDNKSQPRINREDQLAVDLEDLLATEGKLLWKMVEGISKQLLELDYLGRWIDRRWI